MTVSLAFLGDGLTANGQWEEWFPEYVVHNLAASGNTTDEIISQLDQVIELRPDAIVIGVGTNDLGWRKSDEYVVRNLETILHTLRRALPETRIMVQSVLPRDRDFAGTIRSINRHVWQYAPTQHAQYLDLWPALALPDGELDPTFGIDRLHLNEAGYAAWLAELRPGLEMLFERPPSTTSIPIQHA
ncbi:GDSL-type esterase/lipase family protein [Cryobacterium sp. M91]|uniref:GDSL-type esterase/lipase family protein n=1 Tax=Cryobacterium sp. M91 TaxID=2048294 RepID=UPI000CE56E45|nr:GDSL-type esterase/lipase family protein [Cryobacterium sp. M91]